MNSNKPSDAARPRPTPRPIDWRVATAPADVIALRRLREVLRPWPLTALNLLAPTKLFPIRVSRRTPDGGEPFRL